MSNNPGQLNTIMSVQGEEVDISPALEKAQPAVREKVTEAFFCLSEGCFEDCRVICEEILAEQPVFPEVEGLLVQVLYLIQGPENLKRAYEVIGPLVKRYPRDTAAVILKGKVCHARGLYEEAVRTFARVCPLEEYEPFVYQQYAASLQELHREKEAFTWFQADLDEYERTGVIPHPVMLDGSFQHALNLSILYDNRRFRDNLELYKRFLLEAGELDGQMQQFVSDTTVMISTQLARKWLRPLFRDFLAFLEGHKVLTGKYAQTIYSGYLSADSYDLRQDSRVSSFMEDYFHNVRDYLVEKHNAVLAGSPGTAPGSEAAGLQAKEKEAELRRSNYLRYLCYNWYLSRNYEKHRQELDYIAGQYPHTAQASEKDLRSIQEDPEAFRSRLLEELLRVMKEAGDEQDEKVLRAELDDGAEQAEKVQKEPMMISREGTFRRGEKKIGRNDPCPCGSGKKYKNCCGR